jgi:anti-sigma regulatory factor (Ser/Thr protein kinase)
MTSVPGPPDPHHAAARSAGFHPPDLDVGEGAGLWVARQLADVVAVETRPGGTVVELQFPLS